MARRCENPPFRPVRIRSDSSCGMRRSWTQNTFLVVFCHIRSLSFEFWVAGTVRAWACWSVNGRPMLSTEQPRSAPFCCMIL
eukprot:scaffold5479_cov199-Amphora_coffeaeformis.AAC.103